MSGRNPLVEVFGYPADDFSAEAARNREEKLCPFHNKVPECTKDKKSDPLGACDVRAGGEPVITCPQRLTEDWIIVKDAAEFFFEEGDSYRVLREYRLKDANGEVVGNVDIVLIKTDELGNIIDFGAIEVQSVYVTGNMRKPFEHYMQDPEGRVDFDWRSHVAEEGGYYPSPDWRSSHKRLFRQLNSKGSLFRDLGKKQAVVIQQQFYDSMPDLSEAAPGGADLVWLIYDLEGDSSTGQYSLTRTDKLYTTLESTLEELQYFVPPDTGTKIRAALERKLKRSSDSLSFVVE
jgi:hypothetical protein